MKKLIEKRREFFELADEYYIGSLNDYYSLMGDIKDEDPNRLQNDIRSVSSRMALACEYYLKGILFSFLRIDIPQDKEKYRAIIEKLSDDDRYSILIGQDDVIRRLSQANNIALKELKFLQNYSIKSCGHGILDLLKKLLDSDFSNVPSNLKDELFDSINSYFIEFVDENASKEDIMSVIEEAKISDAYVRGRYGHLDDYKLDYYKLVKLTHALRNFIIKSRNGYSLINGTGPFGLDGAKDTIMIFPDPNTKVYILDENNNITRVYRNMDYTEFLDENHDLAREIVSKETNFYHFFDREKEEEIIKEVRESRGAEYEASSLTLVPDYGLEEIKRVYFNHNGHGKSYYMNIDLLPNFYQLYLDKDKIQTIVVVEDGSVISYKQNQNGKIKRNSNEKTLEISKVIDEFEKESHSKEDIAREFVDFEEEKNRQIKSIAVKMQINYKLTNDELKELRLKEEIERAKGDRIKAFTTWLRKRGKLTGERKRLIRMYKELLNGKGAKK